MSDLFSALHADLGVSHEGDGLRFVIGDASARLDRDEIAQLWEALGLWLREGGGEEYEEGSGSQSRLLCLLTDGKPTCIVESFPVGNYQGRIETRCKRVHSSALLGFAPLAEVKCEGCRIE